MQAAPKRPLVTSSPPVCFLQTSDSSGSCGRHRCRLGRRQLRKGGVRKTRTRIIDGSRLRASRISPLSASCTLRSMVMGETTEELIRSKHEARLHAFYAHPSVSIVPDISLYHWYHTVDLGDGVVTPGQYDYRESVGAFPFPQDMSGLTMLEIGSATGFFTFEAERRGATVTSVELPSFHVLDRFPGQSQTRLLRRLAQMRTPHADLESDPLVAMTSAQTYFYHLDGPFQFCYRMVASKVNRVYSTIYDLKESSIAGMSFDYVLLGDVLLHLFNPVDALAIAASFSRDKLIISQQMPNLETDQPILHYVGGENLDEDDLCWFLPNLPFFKQFCRKLGFATVDEVGRNQGCLYPSGYRFDRSIILAER